jgi:hypothetical protein|tara:strand:+ start:176 stop:490 length:315 start_codon:yes stop_codon:yes gene_type:complete
MTKSPELRLFRAIITQAIEDAMYNGLYKYKIIDKREAIAWLTGNSNDFRMICHFADINHEYASLKFTKAMKLDIYTLTDMQNKVMQNRPQRPHKEKNYRLTFND